MTLAQATGVPNSGASNASDFQPRTSNPQGDAVPTEGSSLQTPGSAEILNSDDLNITIPGATASVASRQTDNTNTTEAKSGAVDLAWVIVLVLIVIYSVLFLAHRRKAPTKDSETKTEKPAPNAKKPKKPGKKTKKKSRRR